MRNIKRLLETKDRAKTVFNSINEPVVEIVELKKLQETGIFGCKNGVITYFYFTSKPYEIKEIINGTN